MFCTKKLVNILLEADSKDNNTNLQSTTFTTGWAGSNTHAVHLLPGPQSRHVAVSNHSAIDFCGRQQLCMRGNPEMSFPPGPCLSLPLFSHWQCWPADRFCHLGADLLSQQQFLTQASQKYRARWKSASPMSQAWIFAVRIGDLLGTSGIWWLTCPSLFKACCSACFHWWSERLLGDSSL